MIDRFKFRVWIGKERALAGYGARYLYFNAIGGISDSLLKNEGFDEIEFCTGLKDKNGKLIYEGDIVEYYNEKVHQNFREEVLPFRELRTKGIMRHLIDERNADKLEVIGNIHENADLIKVGGK